MILYDNPSGANTPFIPPASAVRFPSFPTPEHCEQSSRTQQAQTPMNYSYFPSVPPFIPPTPATQPRSEPPGSYYPAPSALPTFPAMPPAGYGGQQGHHATTHVSADFTGYPTAPGTKWAAPLVIPLHPNAIPPPPLTGQHIAYNAFNRHLPGTMWPMPLPYMRLHTPAAAAWPLPPGLSPHPAVYAASHPWQHTAQQPPPIKIPGQQADTAQAVFRWTSNADRMDPFAEGPHYGPVLEPFLVKAVGAIVQLNPLLAPPTEIQNDYLRWNMLFQTSNCYRTTEPLRSWVKGRNAPATYPRLSHVRIISQEFPWMIHVHAQNPKLGVTCGEVLDMISTYMYGDVAKREYESLPAARKRQVWDSYCNNRSTDLNVPGGRLGEGLKRLDWLGSTSRFGGVVVNDSFVKEHCGDVLPCTFELKCLPSYPQTAEELSEQQRQLDNPLRHIPSRPASPREPSPQLAAVYMASDDGDE